jgi:hypothetical protein
MHTFAFFHFWGKEEPPLLGLPILFHSAQVGPFGGILLPSPCFGVWVSLIQGEPSSFSGSFITFFAKSYTFA